MKLLNIRAEFSNLMKYLGGRGEWEWRWRRLFDLVQEQP